MKPFSQPGRATPRTEVVRVLDVADQGAALGRLDGRAVFIPFAAPGDRVEVEIVRDRPRYLEGRLLRVLEPSSLRRSAPCPVFGTCGGCHWQHLPYADQWAGKVRAFEGFLRSRLGVAADRFTPAIASPREWGYRNRVSLKIRRRGGGAELGFFERGTHRLVSIHRCPVLAPAVEAAVAELAGRLQGNPAAGGLAQVDLQQDADAGVWAVWHTWHPPEWAERDALAELSRTTGLAGACLQAGRKATLTPLLEGPARLPLRSRVGRRPLSVWLSPGGFAQANDGVNQSLVDAVSGLADLYRGLDTLDLYCGAGNFTLPLSLEAARVVGVEGYPPAAADARYNANANDLTNIRILAEPTERGLARLLAEGFRPAFALLDPPRQGAGEAAKALARLGPEWILYVSCAPPTLVRDVGVLAAQGYRIQWVRAADLFPQTAHVESVTLLRRVL